MPVGHLVSLDNLTDADLESVFARADRFARTMKSAQDRLAGRILAVLFYEPSTRTRLSFEAAILRLGGRAIGFADAGSSSVSKGETVADTIRIVASYADAVVMRHPAAGAVQVAADHSWVPVASGGDGSHLHPTQTLTDLYYLRSRKGDVSRLTVALCGDLHAGRTVHSLATALARVGARILCVAPKGLRLPAYVTDEVRLRYGSNVEYVEGIEECLPEADVLYMTRLQRERLPADMADIAIPRVDRGVLEKMRPDTIILHPLPRVDEIDYWVDFDPRAAYFEQAAAGVLVRMALLDLLLLEEGFATVARPFRNVDPPSRYARCDNQGCIVRREAYVPHRPVATDWSPGLPRCAYCEMPLVQGALPLSDADRAWEGGGPPNG